MKIKNQLCSMKMDADIEHTHTHMKMTIKDQCMYVIGLHIHLLAVHKHAGTCYICTNHIQYMVCASSWATGVGLTHGCVMESILLMLN